MSKKKRRRSGRGREAKSGKGYTPLTRHRREGKILIPPMMQTGTVKFTAWMNERLPEMLWAVLLIGQAPRESALDMFRAVARVGEKYPEDSKKVDVTHSRLELWSEPARKDLLELLTHTRALREALRPLLLFETLPLRPEWEAALELSPDPEKDWPILARCVSEAILHQSDAATDCRWLRVLLRVVRGQMKFPTHMADQVEEILGYPNRGDLRGVRPSIRALENAIDTIYEGEDLPAWPEAFWSRCFTETPCLLADSTPDVAPALGTTRARHRDVQRALFRHCMDTQVGTSVDAKHDAVFGLASYAVALVGELLGLAASQSISARGTLRTLLEARVTLGYLKKKDRDELWAGYREFGAGQAKLAFQHLDRLEKDVEFVSREALEELADEDMWQEFRTVNIGHWEGANLRELSQRAGLKDLYDSYYPWSSAFSHGHWGAVRYAMFETCRNPLHRFHRIPRECARPLGDVLSDAVELADGVLDDVHDLYPPFTERLRVHEKD